MAAVVPASAQPACPAPSIAQATPGGALGRTTAKLDAGQTVKILAIGSSTTAGVGSGGQGYAQRLAPLMRARAPQVRVDVIVSGVPGETASGAARRLSAELSAHRPDLVVWQLGTNDANFGVSPEAFRQTLVAGLGVIRAAGVDVVLVDPQFSRWAERGPATAQKAEIVAEEGRRRGVPVARRFAAMQRLSRDNPQVFNQLIAWDGLHLTAAGHACMAVQVASTILSSAGR